MGEISILLDRLINATDIKQQYKSYLKLYLKVYDKKSDIGNYLTIEKKIRNYMVSQKLNTSGDYLKTFLNFINKKVEYIEEAFVYEV